MHIDPQHLRLHLNFNKWHNNVPFYFIYILIFFMIIVININIIIFRVIIIVIISVIITIILIYLFIYSFIIIIFFSIYCSASRVKVRVKSYCIMVALKNLLGCWGGEGLGMFVLGIVPKEIHSRLFNPFSN